MAQSMPWSVKGIDPDARDAAKEAARRAGMTLGEWLNTVIADKAAAPASPLRPSPATPPEGETTLQDIAEGLALLDRQRSDTAVDARFAGGGLPPGLRDEDFPLRPAPPRPQRDTHAATRQALDAVQRWVEDAEGRLSETTRLAGERQERAALAVGEALTIVTRRLDDIERRLEQGQKSAIAPVRTAIEQIEERLEQLSETALPGREAMDDTLSALETRLGALVERMATASAAEPRPPRPAIVPVRLPVPPEKLASAIAEIKDHQSHLEQAPAPDDDGEPAVTSPADVPAEVRAATLSERFAAISERLARRPVATRATPAGLAVPAEGDRAAEAPATDAAATAHPPFTPAEPCPPVDRPEPGKGHRDALARKLDEVLNTREPAHTIEARLERLETQPAPDLSRLEEMIRTLAERMETARRPEADGAALDALERQIDHLASRIDEAVAVHQEGAGIGRTLGALERTMVDFVDHLERLHRGTAEAVERVAREAVAQGLAGETSSAEIGSLKLDIADLRSAQDNSDLRTQATLEAVHDTLERVVERLALLEEDMAAARAPASGQAGLPFGLAAGAGRDRLDALSPSDRPVPKAERAALHDIPLEPGSGRPMPAASPRDGGDAADAAAVKASFIAAARRAAQAAAAETAAATQALPMDRAAGPSRKAGARGASPAQRLKQQIAGRRKSLLLGLAGLVVALGAAQVLGGFFGGSTQVATSRPATLPAPGATPHDHGEAAQARPDAAAKAAPPANPFDTDPTATGSINPAPQPAQPAAAQPADGQDRGADAGAAQAPVPGMSSLDIPANVGSAGLRQAVLAGDPAAVYELASRLAEGRSVRRDLTLAARLFEKAADHGSAPAQYRVGSHYEKGLGVARAPQVARQWYQKAAEAGHAKAMHNLAVLLAEGVNGKPDYAGAVGWFRKAAELGVRDSQYNLAILLARGLGGSQDLVQAYTWFAVAAKQGDDDAGRKRDEVGTKLSGTDMALAKAALERWRAKLPDAAANDVAMPAAGWDHAAAGAPARTSARDAGDKAQKGSRV